MNINFRIKIATQWGQEIYLQFMDIKHEVALVSEFKMDSGSDGYWYLSQDAKSSMNAYRYVIRESGKYDTIENGKPRTIEINSEVVYLNLNDTFRWPDSKENNLFSAPFYKAFFKRKSIVNSNTSSEREELKNGDLEFQLRAPRVGSDYHIGILGSSKFLGEWNVASVQVLSDEYYPFWSIRFDGISLKERIEYKYVIVHTQSNNIVTWENGSNRILDWGQIDSDKGVMIYSDEYFSYPLGDWKCAGSAIPIFSIRTAHGAGVGEFGDIPLMVDWSVKTGLQVVQVLPVNDTVASHTWRDSYPYAAISVHALHPIYASMKLIGDLKDKKQQKTIDQEAERLNALAELDYEGVMKMKSSYFKLKFDEEQSKFLTSNELRIFLNQNESWVIAYAVFSYLRDKFQTADFNQWGEYVTMTDEQLKDFASINQNHYNDIAVHYFIQYHLDKQLKSATNYARQNGVVLKGDIPIGIYRSSVDAWRWPHLFNMDSQTGAPPDDFSTTGQNWGFPTYNWEAMAKENYSWWISRMTKMSDYFDVFRIDHILGFFRIWEMDSEQIQGLLGRFYPALSFSESELKSKGIDFSFDRFCNAFYL